MAPRRRLLRWTGRYRSGPPNHMRRATVIVSSAALVLATLAAPAFTTARVVSQPAAAATAPVQVLVFHGPAAQQDDPVVQATARIKALGAQNGFSVDESADPAVFTFANLAR